MSAKAFFPPERRRFEELLKRYRDTGEAAGDPDEIPAGGGGEGGDEPADTGAQHADRVCAKVTISLARLIKQAKRITGRRRRGWGGGGGGTLEGSGG